MKGFNKMTKSQQDRLSKLVANEVSQNASLSKDNKELITSYMKDYLTYKKDGIFKTLSSLTEPILMGQSDVSTPAAVYDAVSMLEDNELKFVINRSLHSLVTMTTQSLNVTLTRSNIYATFTNELLVCAKDKVESAKSIEERSLLRLQEAWDIFEASVRLTENEKASLVSYSEKVLLTNMIASTVQLRGAYLFSIDMKDIVKVFLAGWYKYKDELPNSIYNEFRVYVTNKYSELLQATNYKEDNRYLTYPYEELIGPIVDIIKQSIANNQTTTFTTLLEGGEMFGDSTSYELTYTRTKVSLNSLYSIIDNAKEANPVITISDDDFVELLTADINQDNNTYTTYQSALIKKLGIIANIKKNTKYTYYLFDRFGLIKLSVSDDDDGNEITIDTLDKIEVVNPKPKQDKDNTVE